MKKRSFVFRCHLPIFAWSMSFTALGLGPETLKAIAEVGYTTPTPIQTQAIPVVLERRDVLGIAQTGTGKTASFALPMIEILARGRARARMPRSLILTPTRELAAQVAENFSQYGRYHKLSMALLVGGESFTDQIRLLDRGVDILIATPGRLLDLFQRGRILLSDVRILVIDEADRMLDMGFIPDVERIVGLLPRQRQTLFFSATMQPEVKRLADAFLHDPQEIYATPPAKPAGGVTQILVTVDLQDKREALRYLLRTEKVKNAFVFCNRKRDIGVLHRSLLKHGFPAGMLHGDMPQPMRTETLEKFKSGEISLLICSDVVARGIDVVAMSHVFNFDVPTHAEDYIHRIGRTGRAGMSGYAFTLAVPEDGLHVAAIEKMLGHAITRATVEGLDAVNLVVEHQKRHKEEREPKSRNRHRNERRSERTEERDNGRRRVPRDDGTGVAAMDHPDDVLGFGDHVPDFFMVDPLKNLEAVPISALNDEEITEKNPQGIEHAATETETATETATETETLTETESVAESVDTMENVASGERDGVAEILTDALTDDSTTPRAEEENAPALQSTDESPQSGEQETPPMTDAPPPPKKRSRPKKKVAEGEAAGEVAAAPKTSKTPKILKTSKAPKAPSKRRKAATVSDSTASAASTTIEETKPAKPRKAAPRRRRNPESAGPSSGETPVDASDVVAAVEAEVPVTESAPLENENGMS